MNIQQFEARKQDHLSLSLSPANQAAGRSGLESIHLNHEAIPDLDFEEVNLETPVLGRLLPTPFYVASMTAGHADAVSVNSTLARACQERGWAMGVGSQRRELEAEAGAGAIDNWQRLRQEVPGLVLFANIGLSQLVKADVSDILRLVDALDAQAVCIHLNALQEAIQPEGTPQFKGAWKAIEDLCRELGRPVIVKETGCGFHLSTLRRLAQIGPAVVDVSGLGGTHWGRIEGARAAQDSPAHLAAATFAGWGESTVDSVLAAVEVMNRQTEIWASGGVRSGLDAAKLIALGAHRVGYAKPALESALAGPGELRRWMELQEYELRIALFCTGHASTAQLRGNSDSWRLIEA
ncbi:MAG TPA: type 2 isopentenyl-diphosphate Delta-isomerase [Blastocatellia bacterium]|nr:type 2 isopentenyl-diphosphate Delta-isomerase [Blastocatellia bacterium]